MSPLINARDRLLLAFANLASYGIYARPAVGGSLPKARERMITEAATRIPFAPDDYVFWRRDDESSAFDETGDLVAPLPVHFGDPSLTAAIARALSDAGFSDLEAAADGEFEPARLRP